MPYTAEQALERALELLYETKCLIATCDANGCYFIADMHDEDDMLEIYHHDGKTYCAECFENHKYSAESNDSE